jgi:hypothetical protein
MNDRYCISSLVKDFIIDYITPDEISVSRFKKNDIVFVIIFDLLECFHLADKKKYNTFKNALKQSNNVYPPYKYQKFINNKGTYYKYLSKSGIPVAPTECISDFFTYKRNVNEYVSKFLKKIPWGSFIIKPVYGQESFGFAKFLNVYDNIEKTKRKLKSYFKKIIPKYKSVIVQKYIPGFDKNSLEARLYYIGGKYLFSMTTSGLTHTTSMREARPVQEGGTFKITNSNWNFIRKLGDRVFKTLPKFNLPPGMKNSIITRIDIGSGLEGVPRGYFLNEVEFFSK